MRPSSSQGIPKLSANKDNRQCVYEIFRRIGSFLSMLVGVGLFTVVSVNTFWEVSWHDPRVDAHPASTDAHHEASMAVVLGVTGEAWHALWDRLESALPENGTLRIWADTHPLDLLANELSYRNRYALELMEAPERGRLYVRFVPKPGSRGWLSRYSSEIWYPWRDWSGWFILLAMVIWIVTPWRRPEKGVARYRNPHIIATDLLGLFLTLPFWLTMLLLAWIPAADIGGYATIVLLCLPITSLPGFLLVYTGLCKACWCMRLDDHGFRITTLKWSQYWQFHELIAIQRVERRLPGYMKALVLLGFVLGKITQEKRSNTCDRELGLLDSFSTGVCLVTQDGHSPIVPLENRRGKRFLAGMDPWLEWLGSEDIPKIDKVLMVHAVTTPFAVNVAMDGETGNCSVQMADKERFSGLGAFIGIGIFLLLFLISLSPMFFRTLELVSDYQQRQVSDDEHIWPEGIVFLRNPVRELEERQRIQREENKRKAADPVHARNSELPTVLEALENLVDGTLRVPEDLDRVESLLGKALRATDRAISTGAAAEMRSLYEAGKLLGSNTRLIREEQAAIFRSMGGWDHDYLESRYLHAKRLRGIYTAMFAQQRNAYHHTNGNPGAMMEVPHRILQQIAEIWYEQTLDYRDLSKKEEIPWMHGSVSPYFPPVVGEAIGDDWPGWVSWGQLATDWPDGDLVAKALFAEPLTHPFLDFPQRIEAIDSPMAKLAAFTWLAHWSEAAEWAGMQTDVNTLLLLALRIREKHLIQYPFISREQEERYLECGIQAP